MKNIAKIMVFLLIATAVFVKVSYALRRQDAGIQTYGMQPKDTIDVVYIGGSSCFTYWAPMEAWGEYGFTSFNFANNTLPAQFEKYCLIEAFKTQSPKLVLIDLRPFEYAEDLRGDTQKQVMNMFYEPAIRNFTDNFRYSFNRLQMIEKGVPKEQGRLDYHFDITKYHTQLTHLVEKKPWKHAFGVLDDPTNNFGGFQFYIRYDPIQRVDYSLITEELPFSDTLNPIFLDLVAYCASIDTNVLFIIPPYVEGEENHRKHNYMRRIAEENGIAFLDCNDYFDGTGLDVETDYYDGSHTQIFGAKKYTKWLGQYLQNEYDLPDRRNESLYANWDIVHTMWEVQSAQAEQQVLALMPEDIQAKVVAYNE